MFFRSQIRQSNRITSSPRSSSSSSSKVETAAIRQRVVSNLMNIDDTLAGKVAVGLGLKDVAAAKAAVAPEDMDASPALSILAKATPTLEGRCIGLLVTDGASAPLVNALVNAAQSAGAKVKVVAEKIAGAELSDGKHLPADQRIEGGPSSLFDHVAIVVSDDGAKRSRRNGRGARLFYAMPMAI